MRAHTLYSPVLVLAVVSLSASGTARGQGSPPPRSGSNMFADVVVPVRNTGQSAPPQVIATSSSAAASPEALPTLPGAAPAAEFGTRPPLTTPLTSPIPAPRPGGEGTRTTSQGTTLIVEKVAPEAATVGKAFTYEIIVRNTGTATVHGTHVEERLPSEARFLAGHPQPHVQGNALMWEIGDLVPGAVARMRVQVDPGREGEFATSAAVTSSTLCGFRARVARHGLSLTMTGPQTARVGEEVTFELRLVNNSDTSIERILLRDQLSAGFHHPAGEYIEAEIARMAPGEVKTLPLTARVIRQGQLVNVASVSAQGIPAVSTQVEIAVGEVPRAREVVTTRQDPQTITSPPAVSPSVHGQPAPTAAVIPAAVRSGEQPQERPAAPQRTAWDRQPQERTLPPRTMHEASRPAITGSPTPPVASFPSLPSAGIPVASDRAAINPVQPTRIMPTTPPASRPPVTNVTGLVPTPENAAVTLDIIATDHVIETGNQTIYQIRVINQGTTPCADVEVGAVLPDGLTLMAAEGPTTRQAQPQNVRFAPLPQIGPRGMTIYQLTVKALKPGDWKLRVYLRCGPMERPVWREVVARVYGDQPTSGSPGGVPQRVNNR